MSRLARFSGGRQANFFDLLVLTRHAWVCSQPPRTFAVLAHTPGLPSSAPEPPPRSRDPAPLHLQRPNRPFPVDSTFTLTVLVQAAGPVLHWGKTPYSGLGSEVPCALSPQPTGCHGLYTAPFRVLSSTLSSLTLLAGAPSGLARPHSSFATVRWRGSLSVPLAGYQPTSDAALVAALPGYPGCPFPSPVPPGRSALPRFYQPEPWETLSRCLINQDRFRFVLNL